MIQFARFFHEKKSLKSKMYFRHFDTKNLSFLQNKSVNFKNHTDPILQLTDMDYKPHNS